MSDLLSAMRRSLVALSFLLLGLLCGPVAAQDTVPENRRPSLLTPTLDDLYNPRPLRGDFELPMPCGAKMILRHICVPAAGYFGDLLLNLGCYDCGPQGQRGYMEGKRTATVAGPFTLKNLPDSWRTELISLAEAGDGACPSPTDDRVLAFYYFIGKYEVTKYQWRAVMAGDCPGPDGPFGPDDARPVSGISWYEAVDFTRRYSEWLLKTAPESLPTFSGGRVSYIRLPTEAEWEYAARGGHIVPRLQMNQEEFFPLNDRPIGDFAVFTDREAAKLPERLAWVGSRNPNPAGLFDTAGNAAEMVLDPFRFSIDNRLHGAAGGIVIKGGSFRKTKVEIMPGRREEVPFFLRDGAFRSSDLGFRVILSGIVTPADREEALAREWAVKTDRIPGGEQAAEVCPPERPAESVLEPSSGTTPLPETVLQIEEEALEPIETGSTPLEAEIKTIEPIDTGVTTPKVDSGEVE